jgi:hypothetical protein
MISGLSRFVNGFKAGYDREGDLRRAHEPQVKDRTAALVVGGILLFLVALTTFAFLIPQGKSDSAAGVVGPAILNGGKVLFAVASIWGGLYLRKRRKNDSA